MRLTRLGAALAAVCLVPFAASCGGDTRGVTAPDAPRTATLAVSRTTGVTLNLVSGGGQTGVAGHPLPDPIVVRVLDQTGAPVPGATVNFIAAKGSSATPSQANTDAGGYASAVWTLGSDAKQTLRVSGKGGTLVVSAMAVHMDGKLALVMVSGNNQHAPAGTTLPERVVARVLGEDGRPAAGVTVQWKVGSGGSISAPAPTDSLGYTGEQWTLGVRVGSQLLTASLAGGPPVYFRAIAGPPPVVVVRVRVTPDSLLLDPGKTGAFTAVALDAAGKPVSAGPFAWTSSAVSVATVDSIGVATGVAAGTATITATVNGVSGTARVRVRVPPPPPPAMIPLVQMRVGCCGGIVDVTHADQELHFWIHVASRANSVSMRVRSPAGNQETCVNVDATDDTRREFGCTVYLPAGSKPGDWKVDPVIVDGVTYNAAALAAMGTAGREFDVFGTGTDTSPPEVRTVVPRWWSGGHYFIEWGLIDHISGVSSSTLRARGPHGEMVSCEGTSTYGALARLGTWICALPVTAGSGTWHVESITATDGAGNSATYTTAQIDQIRGVRESSFLTYDFNP